MRALLRIFWFSLLTVSARGGITLPQEIEECFKHAVQSEGLGDIVIENVDRDVFINYVKKNWRQIAENIEILPQHVPPPGFIISSEEQAFNATVGDFACACENLEPLEYIDFLDTFLTLYEKKKISFQPINTNFLGKGKKHYFLAANWEHPRVKAVCERAESLLPDEKGAVHLRKAIESIRKGELADNYLLSQDELPPPETLPGIKLKRPFESLLAKAGIQSEKRPPSKSKERNDSMKQAEGGSSLASSDSSKAGESNDFPWLTFICGWVLVAAIVHYLLRRRASSIRPA